MARVTLSKGMTIFTSLTAYQNRSYRTLSSGKRITLRLSPSPQCIWAAKIKNKTEISSSFLHTSRQTLAANSTSEKESVESERNKFSRLQESVSQTYVPLEDQHRIVQDVIDEIWNPISEPVAPIYQPPAEFLERGKTGVFDLKELVDLLKDENGFEIVVITLPKELDYADQMVIVTTRSPKHLMALSTYVRKRFKMKNLKKTDKIPNIINRNEKNPGWVALDLGNIILHLFLQEQRDHYDLEMLWTVGPMFDDLCNSEDPEIIKLLNMIR